MIAWVTVSALVGLAWAVEAGDIGYGESVFQGETVERFDVEILGTLHDWGATGDVILARLRGPIVEKTGVLQGMSGSPVWVNGELIGAVMSTWAFAKDAMAGIRPIDEMRPLGQFLDRGSHPTWVPGQRTVAAPPASVDPMYTNVSTALEAWAQGETLAAPVRPATPYSPSLVWSSTGFSPALMGVMEAALGQPVQQAGARAGRGVTPFDPNGVLNAGDAMAVLLVDGDAVLSAVGTVTERVGDTVLGFGHPFQSAGPVSLPMARARVVALMPSQEISFKMAEPTTTVGALLVDRRSGVSGKLGVRADTLPVRVHLRTPNESQSREFVYEVARMPQFMANLVAWTIQSSVLDQDEYSGDSTARAKLTFSFAGEDDLVTRLATSGASVGVDLANEVRLPLSVLGGNAERKLRIERVEVELDIEPGIRPAQLGRVMVSPPTAAPGDELTVRAEVLPYRDSPYWVDLKLTVPVDMPAGPVRVHVGDGASAFRDELVRGATRWNFPSVQVLREAFSMREPASHLVAYLYAPSRSAVVRGVELERLPPSVLSVLRETRGSSSTPPVPATRLDSDVAETPWVLRGSRQVTLQVTEAKQ